MKDNWI